MKKIVSLLCLLSLGAAVHADYKNVKDLLVDFLALHKKPDKPLDYWIEQLIATIQHDKQFLPFIKDLKQAKQNPQRLQRAFKNHARLFDTGVRAHLIQLGEKKIKEAFEKRSQITKTTIADLTHVEKAAVILNIAAETEPARTSQQKATPNHRKRAAKVPAKQELPETDTQQDGADELSKTAVDVPAEQECSERDTQQDEVDEPNKEAECAPTKQEPVSDKDIQQDITNEYRRVTEHLAELFQHLRTGLLKHSYTPHTFNLESWKRLYNVIMQKVY